MGQACACTSDLNGRGLLYTSGVAEGSGSIREHPECSRGFHNDVTRRFRRKGSTIIQEWMMLQSPDWWLWIPALCNSLCVSLLHAWSCVPPSCDHETNAIARVCLHLDKRCCRLRHKLSRHSLRYHASTKDYNEKRQRHNSSACCFNRFILNIFVVFRSLNEIDDYSSVPQHCLRLSI